MQNLRYLKKISRTALIGLFAVTVVVGTSGLEAETKPKNDELELRIDQVETGLGLRIDQVEAGLDLRIDELEAEVGELTLALQEQTTVNQNQQAKLRRLHVLCTSSVPGEQGAFYQECTQTTLASGQTDYAETTDRPFTITDDSTIRIVG